jgi:CRISPR/Cas system CSM-associated protein Csm3 (group 7 of RAMP superfamily)
MRLAKECGIQVCHTSEKTQLKDGTSLIPAGFHPLGACDITNPCILRSIFGTFREESRIKVTADPLARIKHKEYTPEIPVQNVHIATENRIALSYDGIPIQDFRQSYFSGTFTFEIDVTKLSVDEVKFLMESLLYIEYLGGGKNSGYGKVTIVDFEYQELAIERTAIKNGDGTFQITEETTTQQMNIDNIEDWRQNYLSDKVEHQEVAEA